MERDVEGKMDRWTDGRRKNDAGREATARNGWEGGLKLGN